MTAASETRACRSTRLRRLPPLAILATVAALAAVPASAAASGTEQAFKPIKRTERSLVFRPHRVDAGTVIRAKVRYKLERKSKMIQRGRRVSLRRVRRALMRRKPLTVAKPRRARAGRLVIRAFKPDPAAEPASCAFGSFSATSRPSACWRPYSDSSPFNRALPEAPADVAGSSAIVSRTLGFGQAGSRGGTWFTGGVADTSSDYDHPIYFSQPSDPLYTVHCRKWVSSCEVNGLQVRIPAAARAAGGTDAHMAVIDQQSGWEYDFWETESLPAGGGDLYIGHGGMTAIGTPDADGLGSNATAAHFGLAAGVVRPEELAAGHIEHALFMIVKCTNGTYVWPAEGPGVGRTCSSMGLSNSDAPALGQHFYLDLSDAEIDALGVPAWKKTVLHAMADYGMFVGDTGSDYLGWSLVVESGSGFTSFGQPDPWVSLAKEYGIASSYRSDIGQGVYYFDLAKTVNWGSELQVASPCVSRGTC
jgi:hypothetical protein